MDEWNGRRWRSAISLHSRARRRQHILAEVGLEAALALQIGHGMDSRLAHLRRDGDRCTPMPVAHASRARGLPRLTPAAACPTTPENISEHRLWFLRLRQKVVERAPSQILGPSHQCCDGYVGRAPVILFVCAQPGALPGISASDVLDRPRRSMYDPSIRPSQPTALLTPRTLLPALSLSSAPCCICVPSLPGRHPSPASHHLQP
jgi:hypothetical protein